MPPTSEETDFQLHIKEDFQLRKRMIIKDLRKTNMTFKYLLNFVTVLLLIMIFLIFSRICAEKYDYFVMMTNTPPNTTFSAPPAQLEGRMESRDARGFVENIVPREKGFCHVNTTREFNGSSEVCLKPPHNATNRNTFDFFLPSPPYGINVVENQVENGKMTAIPAIRHHDIVFMNLSKTKVEATFETSYVITTQPHTNAMTQDVAAAATATSVVSRVAVSFEKRHHSPFVVCGLLMFSVGFHLAKLYLLG